MEETTEAIETTLDEIKDPKKVLDALERAKNDAKRFRQEKEELEKKYSQVLEEKNSWSSELLKEKVKNKLEEEGLSNSDRFFKYIDFSSVSFDENKEIIGLENQLLNIKNDFPELFDPKIRVGGKADAAADSPISSVKSVSELQAKYLLGR
jgi:hypothetical protein